MLFLNNREIAILFWFAIVAIIVSLKTDVKKIFSPVLESFLHRAVLSVLLLFLSYIVFIIFCLNGWGLWDSSQIKNTIVWTGVVGLVSIFKAVGAKKDIFFKNWMLGNFTVAFVLGFIVSVHTFPILAELVFQPIIVLIVLMSAVSEGKEEHRVINSFLGWMLTVIGFYLLWWSGSKILDNPSGFFTSQTVKDFSTPIILSFALTPFLYGLFLYATYERVLLTLGNITEDKKLQRYMKWKAILSFGTDTDFLGRWKREVNLNGPKTKQEIQKIISDLLELKKIENNPPVIPESEGWSPYSAKKFLESHGVSVGDYHKGYQDEWVAYSRYVEVGEKKLPANTVTYYIYGNKRAAKRLQLNFFIYDPQDYQHSKKEFQSIANTLFEQATKKAVSAEFLNIVNGEQGEVTINENTKVKVLRDEWDIGEKTNCEIKIVFEAI